MKAIAALLLAGACTWSEQSFAADAAPGAALSEQQRIDLLIRQNQQLVAENAQLREAANVPKTREQLFVACMQAAKGGTSAMAAEAIGEHCDRLLKP